MSRPTASSSEERWGSLQWSTSSVTQEHQWRLASSAGYQRTTKVATNLVDGHNARPRPWNTGYELSQDLHAKQVEILEKKYGGSCRSRRAAVTIQRAYRQYCLNRNFAKLRWEADEKRLSRRFAEFSHSRTVWGDLAGTIQREENCKKTEQIYIDEMTYSDYDNVMAHSYSSDNMLTNYLSQKSSRTLCRHVASWLPTTAGTEFHLSANRDAKNDVISECHDFSVGLANTYKRQNELGTLTAEDHSTNSYVRGQCNLELSDSSESALGSPLEPAVDVPSACFEDLLEKQAADVTDDSFTSGSGDDGDDSRDVTPVNESCDSFQDGSHSKTLKSKQPFDKVNSVTHASDSIPGDASAHDSTNCTEVQIKYRKKAPSVSQNNREDGVRSEKRSPDTSPIWKRKSRTVDGTKCLTLEGCNLSTPDDARLSGAAAGLDIIQDCREVSDEESDTRAQVLQTNYTSLPTSSSRQTESLPPVCHAQSPKVSVRSRKRAYRIGLNLFNKKPENGVRYLVTRKFLDHRPDAVAKFLITRKGLSKQMIGEYLGNLQKPFNMEVLRCFANEIELTGLQVDMALRKFQSYFRMPGEAQKIERLMEAFAARFCLCNPEHVEQFGSSEVVFLLAFAVIMLNTDLHNSNIKPDRKMKANDFIRNLRGIDGGQDIPSDLLSGIYDRIRSSELRPGADHVSHVLKLEQLIFGNKPQLALPHRRLVCYCRMHEVMDPLKRDKVGHHQRELFLFNDVLMVTKIFNKKKKTVLYSFRQIFSLFGMVVHIFETPYYKFGLRLSVDLGGKVLTMLNARNEHDRSKFVEDLKESILEVNDMENLRIEEELKKQKLCPSTANFNRFSKDSGVVDVEMLKLGQSSINRLSAPECERLKKSPLTSSLIDITDNRRGSGVSLDSGVASAESESVGSCQETQRTSRLVGQSLTSNSDAIISAAGFPKPSPGKAP